MSVCLFINRTLCIHPPTSSRSFTADFDTDRILKMVQPIHQKKDKAGSPENSNTKNTVLGSKMNLKDTD